MTSAWFSGEYCWSSVDMRTYCAAQFEGLAGSRGGSGMTTSVVLVEICRLRRSDLSNIGLEKMMACKFLIPRSRLICCKRINSCSSAEVVTIGRRNSVRTYAQVYGGSKRTRWRETRLSACRGSTTITSICPPHQRSPSLGLHSGTGSLQSFYRNLAGPSVSAAGENRPSLARASSCVFAFLTDSWRSVLVSVAALACLLAFRYTDQCSS